MDTETIMVGFHLMIIGMGTVFVFLMIMVFAMNITHKVIEVINKYYPEEVSEIKTVKKTNTDDTEIAIAIACAMRGK